MNLTVLLHPKHLTKAKVTKFCRIKMSKPFKKFLSTLLSRNLQILILVARFSYMRALILRLLPKWGRLLSCLTLSLLELRASPQTIVNILCSEPILKVSSSVKLTLIYSHLLVLVMAPTLMKLILKVELVTTMNQRVFKLFMKKMIIIMDLSTVLIGVELVDL